jgi:Ras-related protein Rab-7A
MSHVHGAKKKVLLKLIILGESGVGKTAILNKYVNGKFIEEHKATIGADFLTKELSLDDKLVTLQIWDTAGQERFQSLGNAFYRGSDACVLVYDITNDQSFKKIEEWRANFISQAAPDEPKKFPFLLLGNKLDKDNQRQVDKLQAETYARSQQMQFYETSAVNGTNIEEAIKMITSIASEMDSVPYFSPEIADRINVEDADDIPPPTGSSCLC